MSRSVARLASAATLGVSTFWPCNLLLQVQQKAARQAASGRLISTRGQTSDHRRRVNAAPRFERTSVARSDSGELWRAMSAHSAARPSNQHPRDAAACGVHP